MTFAALVWTGLSPGQGQVLEAAAIRRSDGEQTESFSRLADVGSIPLIARINTGIKESELEGRDSPKKVLRALREFCGDTPVVIHGRGTLEAALGPLSVDPPDEILDSRLLSRIALPALQGHTLDDVAGALEVECGREHRAPDRAEATADAWRELLDRAERYPDEALGELCRICEALGEPLRKPLERAASDEFTLVSGEEPPLAKAMPDHSELFKRAQDYESPEPGDEPLATDSICRMFERTGAVGRNLPDYEERPEQVCMVEEVCEALNEGRHLMVEAGTGTGKSMAYLVPAIAWACQNEDKVIVSTNTKNLQSQLNDKDLPFLHGLFRDRFESAVLKGRGNYLCVRRFLRLVEHFDRELEGPGEMQPLLPLITWATRTETGDLAECSGMLECEQSFAVLDRVASSGDECAGRACSFRDLCFVRRARSAAELADLVVANHSLLFADLGLDRPILPQHRCVFFDEAHNVEDAATRAFTISASSFTFTRITRRLYRRRGEAGGRGLLPTVLYELDRDLPGSAEEVEEIKDLHREAVQEIEEVGQAAKEFFRVLDEPFEHLPPYQDRVLLEECKPPVGPETEAWQAASALNQCVLELNRVLEEIAGELEELEERCPSAPERAGDVRAQAQRLDEATNNVAFLLGQEEPGFVYWLEQKQRGNRTFSSVHGAPLEVSSEMRNHYLKEKRTVLFTSATMKVGGSFDYMRERLGAGDIDPARIDCEELGSSFDYDSQTLVGAATFLPDPGGRRDELYDEELASFLIDLLRVTRGRALVLCTAYSLVNSLYEKIKAPLEGAGSMVLAQGRDGSREAITEMFRNTTSSVLLGTQSFWEGVDIAGETLSCLILTKLPFHPISDPLVRGRTEHVREQGKDPFQQYTLPEAIISFRQGFGRLIRHRTDRGVIIVTDRRLATKGYGREFLRDLPTEAHCFEQPDPLIRAVEEFLT